jgi:hypothetical protein
VHLGSCAGKPDAGWDAQQAKNLGLGRPDLDGRFRFLVCERDSKFTPAFEEVFRAEAIKVLRTPMRAPRANAYAERLVRTVRTECLDWLLILIGRIWSACSESTSATTITSDHTEGLGWLRLWATAQGKRSPA